MKSRGGPQKETLGEVFNVRLEKYSKKCGDSLSTQSILLVLLMQEGMNNKIPALNCHLMVSSVLLFDLYFKSWLVQACDFVLVPGVVAEDEFHHANLCSLFGVP